MKTAGNGRRFKTAFILGAGLGLRLRPLTERCPKPLLDLGGRPIITYAMDRLLSVGVERFIVNTHHMPEVYREKFPDLQWRGYPVILRHEPVLLDTAGGLKNIEDLIGQDEAILCHNGDIYADLPLERILDFHNRRRPLATLLLRSEGPLLNVAFDGNDRVCDIRNALGVPGVCNCLFTGIYTVETSLLRHITAGKAESIVAVLLDRIRARPGSVAGVVIDEGRWYDIGSPETYRNLQRATAGESR
jgi:NDP-sugar pyrophosphorylase family protein